MASIFGRTEREYAQRIIDKSVEIGANNARYDNEDTQDLASRIYKINRREKIKLHPDNLESVLDQLTTILHYAAIPGNYDDRLILNFPNTVASVAGTRKRRKKTKRRTNKNKRLRKK